MSARLEAELPETEQRLAMHEHAAQREPKPAWLTAAKNLHEKTKAELEAGRLEHAWRNHKAALCKLIQGHTQEELEMHAAMLRHEACDNEKLKEWRQRTILELLPESSDGRKPTAAAVSKAQCVFDDHNDNQYRKLVILRHRLSLLSISALLVVVGWIVFVPFDLGASSETTVPLFGNSSHHFAWGCVVLASLIGSIISSFTSTLTAGVKQRIPLELAASAITFARFALAAVSGIAAVLLLRSGLLDLGALNEFGVLGVAVAAGFSERYLLKAINPGG
jgi:hypothetical protein